MDDMPKRNNRVQRKDGFPWKSILAVVVIIGIVLAVAEMGRVERQYREQANRQALEAMQRVLQGQEPVVRPAQDTLQGSATEPTTPESQAPAPVEGK